MTDLTREAIVRELLAIKPKPKPKPPTATQLLQERMQKKAIAAVLQDQRAINLAVIGGLRKLVERIDQHRNLQGAIDRAWQNNLDFQSELRELQNRRRGRTEFGSCHVGPNDPDW